MKKVFTVVLCMLMAVALAGCGAAKEGNIESLPYQIPYYNDITLDLISADFYSSETEDHGKAVEHQYVIAKFDAGNLENMTDDDKYWADQEARILLNCMVEDKKNGVKRQDMDCVGKGKYTDGYMYYVFMLSDNNIMNNEYFVMLEEPTIQLLIHIGQGESKKTYDYYIDPTPKLMDDEIAGIALNVISNPELEREWY